jgi:methyltransferase (TIGR00027 family)
VGVRGPSFTARGVAQVRASIDRTAGDPDGAAAADRLTSDLQTALPLGLGRTLRSYLAARTRYFDDIVRTATGSAPAQIVLVGAGYDDRAIRFRAPQVTFVEIDHPDTQVDKLARLRRLDINTTGIAYVPVDLESEGVVSRLDDALDPSTPTTIICEALVPYLTRHATEWLLSSLATLPGTRRTLAVEMPVAPRSLPGRMALTVLRAATRATREPLHTICADEDDAEQLLISAGWTIVRHSSGAQLGMPSATQDISYIIAET